MNVENIKPSEVKKQALYFNNEQHCINTQSDDLRGGNFSYSERFDAFFIFFNGINIYSSKTFSASKNRLKKLFDKWGLEFITEQEYFN